jgi:hypothetical protein
LKHQNDGNASGKIQKEYPIGLRRVWRTFGCGHKCSKFNQITTQLNKFNWINFLGNSDYRISDSFQSKIENLTFFNALR